MKNISNKIILSAVVISVLTFNLTMLFLSGKIIDIPHGTQKGGVIAATGYATITIFMSIIGLLAVLIIRRFTKKRQQHLARLISRYGAQN